MPKNTTTTATWLSPLLMVGSSVDHFSSGMQAVHKIGITPAQRWQMERDLKEYGTARVYFVFAEEKE